MRLYSGFRLAAMVAAAALLATACSGGDSGGGSAATSAGSGKTVDLTYWTWAPNMDKVVDVWNSEHPEIQVTVSKQDGGDPAVTKLLTAVKAGSGAPDVMQTEYQKIPTLVSADALADISKDLDGGIKSQFPEGSGTR